MAIYIVVYTIYDWNDDAPVPTTYSSIGGTSVRTGFASTAFNNGDYNGPIGYNAVRFVGLVPPGSDKYPLGFSYGDVGTTYASQYTVEFPDPHEIDPALILASPEPELAADWSFDGARAEVSWGSLSASGGLSTDLSGAFGRVLDAAASGPGYFAELVNSVKRVQGVAEAMTDVGATMGALLEKGIANFETMDARAFEREVDAGLRGAHRRFLDEVIEHTAPEHGGVREMFKTVNVLAHLDGPPTVVLEQGLEVDLSGGARLAVLNADVRYTVGDRHADVVIALDDVAGQVSNVTNTTVLKGGDDVFLGSNQSEQVVSGAGDDYVSTKGHVDLVRSGLGDDTVRAGAGDDFVFAGRGRDVVLGQRGDDELKGGGGADKLHGGGGADALMGGRANDLLRGGRGGDELGGGMGRDRLHGGGGDDVLDGGAGQDLLHGGRGEDMFVMSRGRDRVRDFGEVDSLDLRGARGIDGYGDLMANHVQARKNGVLIVDDGGRSLFLVGASTSDIEASDVLFV